MPRELAYLYPRQLRNAEDKLGRRQGAAGGPPMAASGVLPLNQKFPLQMLCL